jgi:hypothetical protein
MPDLTLERLQLFLLVVLPGIIAIKIYDLFYPPEKRDFGSSLLEAVAYGLINLAIWVLPVLYINQKGFADQHPVWYAISTDSESEKHEMGWHESGIPQQNRLGRFFQAATRMLDSFSPEGW